MTCCESKMRHTMQANLAKQPRRESLDDKEYLVVPVVMAKAGVVMNGAVLTEQDMFAEAWNGVPVTLDHPDAPDFTANSPDAIRRFGMGRIFNAIVEDGALKAEAWVEVEKAEKLKPGLVNRLVSGDQIDVSTGYYSDVTPMGEVVRHTNLIPDHLAFLPDAEGACNWADGCGVRANRRSHMSKAWETIKAFIKNDAPEEVQAAFDEVHNRRGDDNDSRQMVADLISNDDSPFVPDDEFALREMSFDTLKAMREQYLSNKDDKANKREVKTMKADDIRTFLVENADDNMVKAFDAMQEPDPEPQAEPEGDGAVPGITDEDKAALAHARKQYAEHRASLVSRITANSGMTEDDIKDFDTARLEKIANGLLPVPDYSGRSLAMSVNADEAKSEAEAMAPQGVVNHFQKERGDE